MKQNEKTKTPFNSWRNICTCRIDTPSKYTWRHVNESVRRETRVLSLGSRAAGVASLCPSRHVSQRRLIWHVSVPSCGRHSKDSRGGPLVEPLAVLQRHRAGRPPLTRGEERYQKILNSKTFKIFNSYIIFEKKKIYKPLQTSTHGYIIFVLILRSIWIHSKFFYKKFIP